MMKKRKGQSTLEYVIVFTAIIAAVLVFAGGMMKTNVTGSLNSVSNASLTQVQKIDYSGNNTTNSTP